MRKSLLIAALLVILSSAVAHARIKLVALPDRESTTIRLDNPSATLVEEERVLTLQKGTNHIDFSWKGVRIDPNSIRIKVLSHPDRVHLISVSYPPNEAALTWRISSEGAWETRVRISYLLSGIDRLMAYKTVANKKESQLDLRSYLVLRNFSGENFERARCLLDYGQTFTTDIQHEETKRMLFLKKADVPIEKQFTWDAAKKPHDPEKVDRNVGIPMEYVVKNTADSSLGENALSPGKVRVYQDDGHGTSIFLGEDRAEFTPVGDKMELYVGDSRDIVVTQRRQSSERQNPRRDKDGNIVAYDELITETVKIENFKDEKITLTVLEHIQGYWEPIQFSHSYTKKDHSTLEFKIPVESQDQVTMTMRYRLKNVFTQGQWRQFNQVRN